MISLSTAVIANSSLWPTLIQTWTAEVHPADIWQSPDQGLRMDDVRRLQYFALTSPVAGEKIVIFTAGDSFRLEVANALLKLIEEPPSYLRIYILSQTDHFLPTLRSRLRFIYPQQPGGDSIWQSALKTCTIESSLGRQKASQLLYMQALTHSGIKPELIIDSFV